MDQEDKSVREKIMLATLNCIEQLGIHAVTIRNIAKEANVNIAAINYYFRTKDNLFEETLNYAINNALGDSMEIMAHNDQDPYFTMYSMVSFFFRGMLKYPRLMKAFFYNSFIGEDYSGLFIQQIGVLINKLSERLEPSIDEANRAQLKLSIAQAFSIIFFMGIFPQVFQGFLGFDLSEPEKQQEYIDHIFKHYSFGTNQEFSGEQKNRVEQMIRYYMQS